MEEIIAGAQALIFLSLNTQVVPRPFAPFFYAKGRDFHETSLSFF
jgi:hypothetical protein